MPKLRHKETDQEFEVSDLTVEDATYLYVKGLGWWGTDGKRWGQVAAPAKEDRARRVQIKRPEGVEAYEDSGPGVEESEVSVVNSSESGTGDDGGNQEE